MKWSFLVANAVLAVVAIAGVATAEQAGATTSATMEPDDAIGAALALQTEPVAGASSDELGPELEEANSSPEAVGGCQFASQTCSTSPSCYWLLSSSASGSSCLGYWGNDGVTPTSSWCGWKFCWLLACPCGNRGVRDLCSCDGGEPY